MPKMVYFGDFLKTWSLRSNSVTRKANFNGTKIGEKCQKWKIQMRHFGWFSNSVFLVLLPWNGAIEARGQFHCIVYGIFDHRPITESWSRHHDSFVEQIWKNGTWVPSIFLKLGSLSHICIQLQKLEEFYEMATSPSLSFPGLACICESFLHIEKTIPGCSNKRNKKARRQPRLYFIRGMAFKSKKSKQSVKTRVAVVNFPFIKNSNWVYNKMLLS